MNETRSRRQGQPAELDFSGRAGPAGHAGLAAPDRIPLLVGEYHEDAEYTSLDFHAQVLSGHSFEKCTFSSCKFRDMPLSGASFCSCVFRDCEIILAKMDNASLNGVLFQSCKITGVNFTDCSDFGFSPSFRECAIESCIMYGKSLKKAKLLECRLRNCDFGDCDLREADFSLSNFEGVVFNNCNLEKADFRTALGYAIDPLSNKVRNARFSLPEAQSFLAFLGIRVDQ